MTPPLPDLLPIQPFTRPARGEVTLPGSKSITNRALLLAALCDQPVTLTGALFSEDTALMAEALRKLGFAIEADERALTLRVSNQASGFPEKNYPTDIFVGLAGTAARFLTALCAAAPRGVYRIDGVPQMQKRPMKPLIEALRTLGADIHCTGEEGFFPLEIHARGLRDGRVTLDASESSQLLSALLMVAPLAKGDIQISIGGGVREAYVDMTKTMMQAFTPDRKSLVPQNDPHVFPVIAKTKPYRASDASYAVEPDASSASYFLALPLVTGGKLTLPGAKDYNYGLQGDTEFADVARNIGADVQRNSKGLTVGLPSNENLRGFEERSFWRCSDTFLTYAAISPLLDRTTKITGIAHTRKQETDRVAGAARELKKLRQDVVEEHDALTITPRLAALKQLAARGPIEIETYGDHRFAMSFAILGCHDLLGDGRSWLSIRNPACCAKTFPNFFELLESLRKNSLAS